MKTISPNLNWHLEKLPYFVAVAECGSLRKASGQVGLSQPSLSKSIQTLEAACGVQLFERFQKGVRLTQEGQHLHRIARSILQQTREFEHYLLDPERKPQIRLATHELLVKQLVPSLVKMFKREGVIEFSIYTHASVSHLLDRIQNYESDFGITGTTEKSLSLHSMPLWTDSYDFFCSKKFCKNWPKNLPKEITKETITALPFILAPGLLAGSAERLDQHLEKVGVFLKPQHLVASIESVASLIECDLGLGLLPKRATAKFISPLAVRIPFKLSGLSEIGHHDFSFVCREQDWSKNPLAKKIYRWAKPEGKLLRI